MCLISFLKLHLLYIQILPSVWACQTEAAAAGRQLNPAPASCKAPAGPAELSACTVPSCKGRAQELSRYLGNKRTQAAVELCWALLWTGQHCVPGKATQRKLPFTWKAVLLKNLQCDGKQVREERTRKKKGVRNGTDLTGSECSSPVICPSIQDKAFTDKALTVYVFIIF